VVSNVRDSGGKIKVVRVLTIRVTIRDTETERNLIELYKCIAKYKSVMSLFMRYQATLILLLAIAHGLSFGGAEIYCVLT
jgi:hypothetical protein